MAAAAAAAEGLRRAGVLRTPLVPLAAGGVTAHLKLESVHPIGSYKARGGTWAVGGLHNHRGKGKKKKKKKTKNGGGG